MNEGEKGNYVHDINDNTDVLLVKLVIIRYLPLDIIELSKLKSSSKKKKGSI